MKNNFLKMFFFLSINSNNTLKKIKEKQKINFLKKDIIKMIYIGCFFLLISIFGFLKCQN